MPTAEPHVRHAALAIADAVERLDRPALARLGAEATRAQLLARETLHDYLELLWETLKLQGQRPAVRPEYQPLAALLDVLGSLRDSAHQAVHGPPGGPGSARGDLG
ncbi:hypothetical protein CFP65_0110 [Kitasatospora sp. MMS16-BH015]|uniref:hypothetical protein n=1 Tax=Kitasatospora sp. MMS16-BH015 TaxID=2018025 RepID=UPI000CA0DA0B|nr:hypothetical protein [Kitasatospora sp. MMS16-BH015]AUG75094.1 hypothetical protein CFP65_0110 [Kitasatospora sp. MMS16-BH015]